MKLSPFRDPANSPRASEPPDWAALDARELLSTAVRIFPGNLPLARQAFEALALASCSEAVAWALAERDSGPQRRGAHEIIARIYSIVRSFPNPWLALRCLPIAFDLDCGGGEKQVDLAREFGLTKGGVSDICINICERFGIEPGRGMKRPSARLSYSKRQRGRRARPMPDAWLFRGLLKDLSLAA